VKSIKTGKKENVVNDSIEFRSPAINGKTETVNDSVDFSSKGNIYSLHNVKTGAKGGPLGKQPEAKSSLFISMPSYNMRQFYSKKIMRLKTILIAKTKMERRKSRRAQ